MKPPYLIFHRDIFCKVYVYKIYALEILLNRLISLKTVCFSNYRTNIKLGNNFYQQGSERALIILFPK